MQLTLKAIPGIQSLGGISGSIPYCGNNIKLGKAKSCLLVLQITGSKIANTIKTGPYVCIKGTNKCYQPLAGRRLNITKGAATGLATIEAQELFPISVVQGSSVIVHIKNTSPVQAKAITVVEYPELTCPSLAQNDVCTLTYPVAMNVALGAYPFTVKGSNTNTINGQIIVTSGVNPTPGPKIETISPNTGSQQGEEQISISGQNLQPNATVTIGGQQCTNVTGNATALQVITPPQFQGVPEDTPVDVTVQTDNGKYTLTGGFTYLAAGPSCSNGEQDGDETDRDCGGSCGGCSNGQRCMAGSDCQSGSSCVDGICQACTSVWYQDADGDGYGAAQSVTSCVSPAGYVANNTDCDDTDAIINPAAIEMCNGRDDNCDGQVDEGGVCVLPPTISNISPTSGSTAGGYQITINGTNLSGATIVNFGGTDIL